MNLKRIWTNNRIFVAAFFLPVALVILAFAVTGIYPFGENQIPVIDMYHQYVPFLSELQAKLQSGGSLFYTWNGAAGSNFWNLLAYYGASPLNLLLVLFPKKFIVEGVTVILLIKIGLAGSFMTAYLRNRSRSADFITVGFSTLYALCSYVMAYYWCIMWMDAVMLLPLCIQGLYRLIKDGKIALYTITLALIVFINYYMAIMVCIFILFYYPVLYFSLDLKAGCKGCGKITGKAVGCSLLGIAMAAVMLLPTYLSMQKTYYISADMPQEWRFYNDVLDVINQLLPNAQLTYRDGLPNLYCGLIVVILLVFYILCKTIPFREKTLHLVFLAFLFLSLNINKLDFIWHGFHFPNQLPYRYSFMVCFLLIGMAYQAFLKIHQIKLNAIWGILAAGIGYLVLAQKLLSHKETIPDLNLFVYGGIAWLVLYCIVMALYKRGYVKKSMFGFLIVVLIVSEMASNVCTSFEQVGNTQRSSYFENSRDINVLTQQVSDREFARLELDTNDMLNYPALYHYRGISQFSSSVNADVTALMEKIGIEGAPEKNRFNYNPTDPVTNAILNVKYLIGKNHKIEDPDFDPIGASGHSYLYENKRPLSIGYMTGNEIRTWNTHAENPFDVLDDYIRAATGNRYGGVFTELKKPRLTGENMSVSENGDGHLETSATDAAADGRAVISWTAKHAGKHYVFVEADRAEQITLHRPDRGSVEDLDIQNDCGSVINAGVMKKGETFQIIIDYAAGQEGMIKVHACTLDETAWDGAYQILSKNMMQVTEWSDSGLKGTVAAEESGVLATSVPYEEGWTLKVDGRQRRIHELVGGAFIAVPLDQGTHEIELSFRPPGIMAGGLISLGAILLLAVLCQRKRRFRNARQLPALSAQQEFPEAGSDCNTEEINSVQTES